MLDWASATGTFTRENTLTLSAAAQGVLLAKIDGDAYPDLVIAVPGSNQIQTFLADNMGHFTNAPIPANTGGQSPSAIQLVQLDDGDSYWDLIIANNTESAPSDTDIGLLHGDGMGHFSVDKSRSLTGCLQASALTLADIDGDSVLDLIASCDGNSTVQMWLGITRPTGGEGAFGPASLYFTPADSGPFTAVDLDNDGRAELVVANESAATLTVLQSKAGLP